MFRVVIIEDENIVREGIILTTDWDSMDCEVVGEASNGSEGLKLILRLRPEIIITDIKMPLLSGIEMIAQAKEFYEPVVIFLTAFNEFDYAKTAINLGAVDYILKPFKDEEFKTAIRKAQEKVKDMQILKENHPDETSKHRERERYFSLSVNSKHHNILKAIKYIKGNYHRDISIGSTAEMLSVSESYLSHLFKEETSYTFHEYLVKTRIKAACSLLSDPNSRIYEVAQQVGYRDQRYFSKAFKKHIGMTPNEFKETL